MHIGPSIYFGPEVPILLKASVYHFGWYIDPTKLSVTPTKPQWNPISAYQPPTRIPQSKTVRSQYERSTSSDTWSMWLPEKLMLRPPTTYDPYPPYPPTTLPPYPYPYPYPSYLSAFLAGALCSTPSSSCSWACSVQGRTCGLSKSAEGLAQAL